MKIDENGVLYEIGQEDLVDGTLVIPEGVKKIDCELGKFYYFVDGETYSHSMSNEIKDIKLPKSLIEIGNDCFKGLRKIEKIILPDNVTKIGPCAFAGCSAKQIRLSRRLEEIGVGAFINCDLDFLILPDSVKNLDRTIFNTLEDQYWPNNSRTERIKYLRFPKKMEKLDLTYYRGILKEGDIAVLPKEVESLVLAFYDGYNNVRLNNVEVVMPNKFKFSNHWIYPNTHSANEIVDNAKFYTSRNSRGLKQLQDNLNTIYEMKGKAKDLNLKKDDEPIGRRVIGMTDIDTDNLQSSRIKIEGTDVIGEFTFSECQNLEEVIIGEGVKSIERGAFAMCPNLKRIVLPKSLENIGSRAFWGCESLEKIEIISDLDRIGNHAFLDCKALKEVSSKGKVKKIESGAFKGCERLMFFNSPHGPETIGENAFEDCQNLMLAPLSAGVKYIGNSAFKNCNSLISINLPEGVKEIGDNAFENCCSIPQPFEVLVSIPKTVQYIGKYAFAGCKNISYVHMMDGCGVKQIDEGTFLGCDRMEKFDMSDGVQIIGEQAFKDCKSLSNIDCLKTVGLPENMKEIKSRAFENCESLGLVLTNGEIKKEADSFNNANRMKEANKNGLDPNVEIVGDQVYDVVGAPKNERIISLTMIKNAINNMKNKGQTR